LAHRAEKCSLFASGPLGFPFETLKLVPGPELEEQKLLILRKEIQIHCTSDLTHEADQLKLQRCLRDQVYFKPQCPVVHYWLFPVKKGPTQKPKICYHILACITHPPLLLRIF